MIESDDLARYSDLVTENTMPLYGFRLLVYLDEQGAELHEFAVDGTPRLGEIVGALELVKFRMSCEQHGVITEEDDE
jgi:hypothetical protein